MKKENLTGIQRQDAFLRQILSSKLHCPCCDGCHSFIEAVEATGDVYSPSKANQKTICPQVKQELKYNVSLFAGLDFWTQIQTPKDEAE